MTTMKNAVRNIVVPSTLSQGTSRRLEGSIMMSLDFLSLWEVGLLAEVPQGMTMQM